MCAGDRLCGTLTLGSRKYCELRHENVTIVTAAGTAACVAIVGARMDSGAAITRIAVLASGAGSNLQALIDRVHRRDGIEIVAVASDKPAAPALVRARAAGLPVATFSLDAAGGDREARDRAIADWLHEARVDLVVLAGYMQLLSAEFLASFPGRVINVHPALLPAFPGIGAVRQALEYGAKVTGVTVHFVDEGVDTGPIILQRAIEVADEEDPEAVRERLHAVEHELLSEAVRLYARGALSFDPANPRRVFVDR
jgi:phosphoribosylglycinamide formyltransferase 1